MRSKFFEFGKKYRTNKHVKRKKILTLNESCGGWEYLLRDMEKNTGKGDFL